VSDWHRPMMIKNYYYYYPYKQPKLLLLLLLLMGYSIVWDENRLISSAK